MTNRPLGYQTRWATAIQNNNIHNWGLTADRGVAVSTLLSKEVAEAVQAVGEVVARGEALAGQLLLARDADEALLVPGLVPVIDSAGCDWLESKRARGVAKITQMLPVNIPRNPNLQPVQLHGKKYISEIWHQLIYNRISVKKYFCCSLGGGNWVTLHLFPF